MTSFNFKKSLFLLQSIFIACLLSQCSTKKTDDFQVNNEFTKYISAFTSDIISNQSNIVIEFPPATSQKINQTITENLFEFSPPIIGDVEWEGNSKVIFKPTSLAPGTQYNVSFHLNKLIPVSKGLETFKFNLKTITPNLIFKESSIKPLSEESLTWNLLSSNILTSDYIDSELLENNIKVFINEHEYPVVWRHANKNRVHYLDVDSLERKAIKQEVQIRWNGQDLGIDKQGVEILDLASLESFKLLKTIVSQGAQQYISLFFSDPIDKEQDLRGLIKLGESDDLSFEIQNNEIKVYPKTKQSGSSTLELNTSIKNINGFNFPELKRLEVFFESIKPQVQLLGKGVIIPESDGILFPFQTVNLSGVIIEIIEVFDNNVFYFLQRNNFDGANDLSRVGRVVYKDILSLKGGVDINKWEKYSVDISSLIQTKPGAIYRVRLSVAPSQSLYGCIDESFKDFAFNFEPVNYEGQSNNYYNSNFYSYNYSYNDGFSWSEAQNPCHISYYLRNTHSVIRNIMSSPFGIIVKKNGNEKFDITVTDLKTTDPVKGATVKMLNFQNQEISTGKTNSDGFLVLETTETPYLIEIKNNKSIGYLKVDGAALSLSMFDVSGYDMNKGIKGFMYGERDIWRPGDSLYLSFILQDKLNNVPLGHPIKFKLYDPQNVLVSSILLNRDHKTIYDIRTATDTEALTGNYSAKISIGNSTFTKTLKVETIKPNRLKVLLTFPDNLIRNNTSNKGNLKVNWLHGAIAKNLTATIDFSLEKIKTSFEGFKQYTFDDKAKNIHYPSTRIFSGSIDSLGEAVIPTELNVLAQAPGMLNAVFETKVFETGGSFSTNYASIPFSPYNSYVGMMIPKGKGWRDALKTNVEYSIPIATLDKEGNPISKSKIKVEVFKVSWRWWWQSQNSNDLGSYVNNSHNNLIYTTNSFTTDGYGNCKIKFKDDEYGRYYIRITDLESNHSTGEICFVDWPYNDGSSVNSEAANMLLFSTDKDLYVTGDEVSVNFKSSKGGKALITLESGAEILNKFWVDTEAEETSFSFKSTNEMAPNIYIGVHYIQNHNATSNDLPIRMYGIQRVKVTDPNTLLKPSIEAPLAVEPESDFEISISENSGKSMEYTLAVVDEGLLDITNFRTPRPRNYFYSQEALGVKTWDMYDFVMSAFSGKMTSLLAIGGDGTLKSKKGKKPNRFKPVVKCLGPFTLNADETQSHTLQINNYVGAVKVMVVAAKEASYGSSSHIIKVKKPLMVLATAPRILGSNENFTLPVTLFNMDEKKKRVKVELITNEFVSTDGESVKYLDFESSGDKMLSFDLKTTALNGFASIKVRVSSGKDSAVHNITIETRNPSKLLNQSFEGFIESGKSWVHPLEVFGSTGTNNTSIEISTIPPLGLDKRLKYLIKYPHGCIEQTTSSVFPQLVLENLTEISNDHKITIREHINAAIKKIKRFQLNSGGFGYWEGSTYVSDWGTTYAGHFLIKAKEEGYFVSDHVINNWLTYQKNTANAWSVSANYHNLGEIKSQAYRLYSLSLAGNSEIGAMNRLKEIQHLPSTVKALLATSYYLNGQSSIAKRLANTIDLDKLENESKFGYNYGSIERDQALIISCFSEMGMQTELEHLVRDLSDKLNSDRWMSTQSTAVSLLSISNYVGNNSAYNFGYNCVTQLNGAEELSSNKALSILNYSIDASANITVINTHSKALFIKLVQSGIPLNQNVPSSNSKLEASVNYFDVNGNSIDPTVLRQGTDFKCEVTITNPEHYVNYRDLALSQLFPAAWEVLNPRIIGAATNNTTFTHQDIRDDKVLTYFDLPAKTTKTFTLNLNASYLGEFFMPSIQCEAMYDNTVNSNLGGGWIKVIP
jgi:uncharacterized protein YfaS (alpha-2-macroglobulin family)